LLLNQPGAVSVSIATSTAAASISGDAAQITLSGAGTYATALTGLSANGSATGVPGLGSAAAPSAGSSYFRAMALALPFDDALRNFQLSANTLLLVTATSNIVVSTTLADDALTGQQERAYAYTWLELVGLGPAGNSYQRSSYSDLYRSTLEPSAYSHTQLMTASFVNATDQAMDATLYLQTFATGTSILGAAPVPEPESVALLLAGLVLVDAASRRRRRPATS
jgi:hypothetical protein